MEQLPLDESTWTGGLKPTDYFQSLENYKHLVLSLYRDAEVHAADRDRVATVLPHPVEQLRLVVITEDWCGDSATTVPYIARLAEQVGVEARVFRQSRNAVLKQWFVDRGATHIPAVSLVWRAPDADPETPWSEIMRWVERPAEAHGRVTAWIDEHPEFLELRARKSEDPAASKAYFNLYARLLREMASWYRQGLWSAIAEEFSTGISKTLA